MKLPQIFVLLALFCLILTSCRETAKHEEDAIKQENSIPSAEKHQRQKITPKKDFPQPKDRPSDSILKKRKKSKDLDTLKPKVAMLKA
jgi:PBP1b-binding outer membrane lipoprotein LpoB